MGLKPNAKAQVFAPLQYDIIEEISIDFLGGARGVEGADDHSTSISACGIWGMGVRVGVQVFRRKFYTHIHLDYTTRVKFLSCINQKKKKKKIPTSTTILYGNRARPFSNSPKVANSLTRLLSTSFYSCKAFLSIIFQSTVFLSYGGRCQHLQTNICCWLLLLLAYIMVLQYYRVGNIRRCLGYKTLNLVYPLSKYTYMQLLYKDFLL